MLEPPLRVLETQSVFIGANNETFSVATMCVSDPDCAPFSRRFHRIGANSVLLHRGHLPAVSNGTGFVKCFTYRHCLHLNRIEHSSCDCSIWKWPCCSPTAGKPLSQCLSRSAYQLHKPDTRNEPDRCRQWNRYSHHRSLL